MKAPKPLRAKLQTVSEESGTLGTEIRATTEKLELMDAERNLTALVRPRANGTIVKKILTKRDQATKKGTLATTK